MRFSLAGTTNLNLFGDNEEVNRVILRGSNNPCNILSRGTFLANIDAPDDPESSIERINTDSDTQSITQLLIYLYVGENSVHFDDTIAAMVRSRGVAT